MNQKSIYKRTTLATFVSVMVAFTILSLVYFSVMNDRVLKLQSNHIYNLALNLKNDIERSTRHGKEQQTSVQERVDLMAAASGSYIWLVRRDGVIIHASELPAGVIENSRVFESGLIQLPLQYSGDASLSNSGIVLRNSDYTTLFARPGVNWVSVILPLLSSDSGPQAVLQVHYPFSDQYNWRWFFTNGMSVAFIVALLISVGLTVILMNYIAAPLEALAEAAHRVTLGDYSVRVDYGDLTKYQHGTDLNDIDEMAKLVLTFNEMVERLDLVNMEQRDMISGISHDMKTPLTSIIGFTEGILDGTIPLERQQRYLDIIRQEAMRLKNLLADMDQERLIEDRGTANFSEFSINSIFLHTLDSLEKQIQEKQLEIQLHLGQETGRDLAVIADEEQISRVVYNLVSNAVKFCREGDKIRITTARPQGSSLVRCIVEDSGPGIPEENRNQVFGRFFKLDKSRGNREGSGLGLYLCRKTLAQHGQQIFLNASPDLGGARFIFTLATAHPQAEAKAQPKNQHRRLKNNKKASLAETGFKFADRKETTLQEQNSVLVDGRKTTWISAKKPHQDSEKESFWRSLFPSALFAKNEEEGRDIAGGAIGAQAEQVVEVDPLVFTDSEQTLMDVRKTFLSPLPWLPEDQEALYTEAETGAEQSLSSAALQENLIMEGACAENDAEKNNGESEASVDTEGIKG